MPVIMPIVVPVQHTKSCIVVNSKTYCQQENTTKKEIGAVCVGLLLIMFWAWLVIAVSEYFDSMGAGLAVLIVPFVLGAILCLM